MGIKNIYYEVVCMSNLRQILGDFNSSLLAIIRHSSWLLVSDTHMLKHLRKILMIVSSEGIVIAPMQAPARGPTVLLAMSGY